MSAKTQTNRRKKTTAQRGFSMMQLIVTLAVVSVVSGLAVMGIASARQRIRLTNSARVLASWAEKARVDSVRRHPTDPNQMAGIEVLDKTTYRVKMDFDGDGTVETRDVTLDEGVEFATDPIALVFDWRGRLVDLETTDIKVSIALQWGDDAEDQRLVDITRSGDVTLDSDVYLDDIPNVNSIESRSGVDGGSTLGANNNPNATPTPTPAAEQSPTPNASPTPEVIDLPPPDGGGVEPTPDPTPESDATPTPTPNPGATPSPSPGTNPSPTPTPCVVTTSTSPSPLTFSKHGGGTVSFSVNPNGQVEFSEGPNNLSVTRTSGNSFAVASLNNSRGNFTLIFKTPCGSKNVSVTVVN
jgi:Tfp pilus assembly protein FimT